MAFDVFITYAGEDKRSVARPIAEELRARGWSVWFDEFELRLGDSFVAAVERGLADTQVGVAIFSPAFFGKHWPRRELEALVARELAESRKLILPVWHDVDVGDVAAFSPSLADRLAIKTSVGLPAVIDAIEEVLHHSLDLLGAGRLPTATGPDGRPLDQEDPARKALDLSVVEFNDRLIAHLAAHPERLYELSPRRFEELVAELYSRAGFEVQLTPASGDGGVDVYAIRREDLGSTLTVVQAKRYKPEFKVEASVVRELFGTVNLTNASAGVLVTTSSFQPGAKRLAEQHEWRLSLRDYARLQQMLREGSAGRTRRSP
jgi:hypothetical protein